MASVLLVFIWSHEGCDVLVEDKSVSRAHAELKVDLPKSKEQLKDVTQHCECFLTDKSKFGTLVNGQRGAFVCALVAMCVFVFLNA